MNRSQNNKKAKASRRKTGKKMNATGARKMKNPANTLATFGVVQSRTTTISRPANLGAITSTGSGFRIGAAAPHEDFPHGGIRLGGIFGAYSNSGAANQLDMLRNSTTSSVTVAIPSRTVVTSSFNHYPISPTAISNATFAPTYNMFGYDAFGANAISSISQYFTKFRFRRLGVRYNGTASTNTSDQIQMSYVTDVLQAQGLSAFATFSDATYEQNARFPVWTPEICVDLIKPQRAARDDELFYCTLATDSVSAGSTGYEASAHQYFQGAAVMLINPSVGTTSSPKGTIQWEFELDLYGFKLNSSPNISFVGRGDDAKVVRTHGGETVSSSKVVSLDTSDKGDSKRSGDDRERQTTDPIATRSDSFVLVPKTSGVSVSGSNRSTSETPSNRAGWFGDRT